MDIFQQHLLSALLRVTGKGCRAGRLNAADGRQASRRKGRDVIKGIAREQIIPFREAVVDARVEGMAELRIGRAINEMVLTVLWLSTGSGEIIPRVEHVISHKLVHGAMELVGTRFSNQIYDGARRFPDFGRI